MGNVFLRLLNISLAANWLICPFSIESSFGLVPSGDIASTNNF